MHNKPPFSEQYPDLLACQDDPALRELIADLETLHTSHPLPARLARPLESGQPVVFEAPTELSAPLPGTLLQRPPRNRARWSRWNALAAVISVVLLAGTVIGAWALVHFKQSEANKPHPSTCHASSVPAFPIESVHMMTMTEGWALLWTQGNGIPNRLLHTSDGGCHWIYVTPATGSTLVAVYYLTGRSAWIMTSNSTSVPASVQFARTTDGGLHWQTGAASSTGFPSTSDAIRGVSFINAEVGWLLSATIATNGGPPTRLTLYHSVDGGLTWSEITHHATTDPAQPSSLPADLLLNGLSFLDSSTGWIAGGGNGNESSLLVTHDGGLTWQRQQLALPRGISTYAAGSIIYPPQFFSDRDGILTVSSWAPYGLTTYVTHDAGATWQSTAFLHMTLNFPSNMSVDISSPSPVPVFIASDFGWFWTGDIFKPQHTLFVTRDGGMHWVQTASLPSNYACHSSDFISPTVGWITCALNGLPAPELFQTHDGGKSWQHIDYIIT